MQTEFRPRLDILAPPQRRLWAEFAALPREFVLYGGTAVALQLGHRQSVDFDFFSAHDLDTMGLTADLPFLTDAVVTQRAPNTLSCVVDRGGPINLSFFGVPALPRLSAARVSPGNGVRVASLLDLAGMKVSVVQLRAEAKDYLDIDAIIADGGIDLPTALASASAIYGSQFNPELSLKALTYFDDGNLRQLPEAIRLRLVTAVRAVDLDRLPAISGPRWSPPDEPEKPA